jgi:hypothetical protein
MGGEVRRKFESFVGNLEGFTTPPPHRKKWISATASGESKWCRRENVLLWKIIFQNILVHTRIIKIQMLNCQLSTVDKKIDRPRPGLSRLCPRPHTKALGTRLPWILIGRITCHIWPRIARVNWSCYLSHSAHACPSDVIYLHANYFQSQVTSLGASLWTPEWGVLLLGKDNTSQNNLVQIMSLYILYRRVFASVQEVLGHDRGRDVIKSYWQYRLN